MRLQGKTFIPGFKIEADDEEDFDEQVVSPTVNGVREEINVDERESETQPAIHNTEQLAVNEPTEQTAVRGVRTTIANEDDDSESSAEEDSDDERSENSDFETECYESYTRFRNKKKEPEIPVEGVDWESVNYQLNKLPCDEDEITGLDVSESYIVAQYYIESAIDVYDRKSFKHLFRLDGHEYGGQCLKISECSNSHSTEADPTTDASSHKSLLYSASMDCSLKSWNLNKQCLVDSITDHCDYVNNLTVFKSENADFIATGGRGDKAIFVYKASNEGKFNRLFKLQGHTGWVNQTIFIDGSKPDSSQESKSQTRDGNDQCPAYLLSGGEDGTIKFWDLNNKGVIRYSLEQDAGISCMILSKLKGSTNTMVVFGDREGKMSYLDLGTPEQLKNCENRSTGCGNGITSVGQSYGDNDDDDEPSAVHLLPNILIGTGKYCRSCKYHDKAVDTAHLTENGYLITASAGSKYVKIWKINVPATNENKSAMSSNSVNSEDSRNGAAASVGATTTLRKTPSSLIGAEDEDSTSKEVTTQLLSTPEDSTEVCDGPRLCRTGKTGLVRSSSSFQVSFQLKPGVCTGTIKLPIANKPAAIQEEDEWDPDSDSDVDDSDEYEVEYEYVSEEDSDSS